MTAALAEQIDVINVGAIERLSIPLAPGGGVTVLRGRNGSGKSTALRAIDRMVTGNKDVGVNCRDGAPMGRVTGFGVTLRVGKSVTRTGELEVESLEGRLSVAELVDPNLKNETAADARRVKALTQLAGIIADKSLFYDLVGGEEQFAEITAGAKVETDDLLDMADRVKRAIEAKCRAVEGLAATAQSRVNACRESASDINTEVETDETALKTAHENAIRELQDLQTRLKQHQAQKAAIDEATAALEQLVNVRSGPTSEEAAKAVELHKQLTIEAGRTVLRLREELRQAESQEKLRQQEEAAAQQELRAAQQHENAEFAHRNTLEKLAAITEAPDADDITAAEQAVSRASLAIEAGTLARRAKRELETAEKHAIEAKAHEKRASVLRQAAASVDDVLSEQIAKLEGCPLKVEAGRLVVETRRGKTLYAELSEGERWRIALDIAISAVGKNGLLQVPQEAWEGLDPINRQAIADHLAGREVWIVTAEATGDEVITAAAV